MYMKCPEKKNKSIEMGMRDLFGDVGHILKLDCDNVAQLYKLTKKSLCT